MTTAKDEKKGAHNGAKAPANQYDTKNGRHKSDRRFACVRMRVCCLPFEYIKERETVCRLYLHLSILEMVDGRVVSCFDIVISCDVCGGLEKEQKPS